MNAVPGARTQTTLPLSPSQSNMAPPSEDNGKVKKDITKLPWRCAHHIRVIYTVNGMLLCLGYGCSSASPPPLNNLVICSHIGAVVKTLVRPLDVCKYEHVER